MTATAAEMVKTSDVPTGSPSVFYPLTFEEYLPWNPKDGFKYEWVDGQLLKSEKMITEKQFHIANNLTRFFARLKAYQEGNSFLPEVKSLTIGKQVRVPDLAYFTVNQQVAMANGQIQTPLFAVEIISETDDAIHVETKLEEYFSVGVRVVWHIIPDFEKVYVYTSPIEVSVCRGAAMCSAESVIEGFSLPTSDIFKKPIAV